MKSWIKIGGILVVFFIVMVLLFMLNDAAKGQEGPFAPLPPSSTTNTVEKLCTLDIERVEKLVLTAVGPVIFLDKMKVKSFFSILDQVGLLVRPILREGDEAIMYRDERDIEKRLVSFLVTTRIGKNCYLNSYSMPVRVIRMFFDGWQEARSSF